MSLIFKRLESSLVGKLFSSVSEILAYIRSSTSTSWDPAVYSSPPKNADNKDELTMEKLYSLVEISGLKLPESEAEQVTLLKALNSQIYFLGHLQMVPSLELKIGEDARNLNKFNESLSFKALMSAVQRVRGSKGAISKGATLDRWCPVELAKPKEDNFYGVKEKSAQ